MSFFRQLKYLIYKNFLLRKRQKLITFIELIWPLGIFWLLKDMQAKVEDTGQPTKPPHLGQGQEPDSWEQSHLKEMARIGFFTIISSILPILMILNFIFSASLLVKNIVYEKEVRLKEFMKVMGLENFALFLGWLIQSFIIGFVSIAIFCLATSLGGIFNSNLILLILAFSSYLIASISLCFFMGALFRKSTIAAVITAFSYFLLYFPYAWYYEPDIKFFYGLALCFFPQSCLAMICRLICDLEINLEYKGLSFSNLFVNTTAKGNVPIILPIVMCYVDAVLYYLLAAYIENVFPGEYGVPKPFYFFLTKSFWFGDYREEIVHHESPNEELKNFVEEEPEDFRIGVQIQNVTKIWPNGVKALDNLTVNFYKNQITSFLGHNGAGKTTTISILTGLVQSTSGTVYVNGKDVRKQIDEIRQSLGMCPQHNILYDMLSIEEQLHFYAGLKGVPPAEIKAEINRLLNLLNLTPKRNSLAKELSGGTKRRLSIAIAFLGQSKIVVLDEPTSGVDPYSRRQIWDLLTMHKADRTIIMSTHFMDEADILGDRIAIITSGKLKCVGSGLFLKKAFGSNYSLHATLGPNDHKTLTGMIVNIVPGAEFLERKGQEAVYSLPTDDPNALCQLFEALETPHIKEKCGIFAFGLSEMSLEEIFLKIDPIDESTFTVDAAMRDLTSAQRIQARGCFMHNLYQIWAVFIKRFLNFRRNLIGFFVEIILPIIVVGCSFIEFKDNAISTNVTNISTTMSPIYVTTDDSPFKHFSSIKNPGSMIMSGLLLLLGFSIVPASFVMFMIDERVSGAKHLQFVNGLHPIMYWIGNFLWDMINFMIPVIGVMGVFFFVGSDTDAFRTYPGNLTMFLTLMLYGFSIIPMFYILSFIFKNPTTAFLVLMLCNFIGGAILFTFSIILTVSTYFTRNIIPNTEGVQKAIVSNFDLGLSFFPTYSLSSNIVAIFLDHVLKFDTDPFDWQRFLRRYVILAIEGVLFLFVAIFFENIPYWCHCLISKWPPLGPPNSSKSNIVEEVLAEDEDVRLERQFALSPASENSALRVLNLSKVFGTGMCNLRAFRAVNDLSFTVRKAECFGLLGVNGAGKTSTFDILTGKHSITNGNAFFSGHSVLTNPSKVRQQIGFCPQFDALNGRLTARDHLFFYGRLRGMGGSELTAVVDALIIRLDLIKFATKVASTYSGGNKRKLSTAIAIIGNPPVVLFDEPTTGMDPKARRFVWIKIQEMVKDGRSVVLTSHSMEECEFLCNRLGIMVAGEFRCMGTVQHLKHKFGGAYTLKVKLNGLEPKSEEFIAAMQETFPEAVMKERHFAYLTFQFLVLAIPLSKLYRFVTDHQSIFGIEQYSLSQTTLEDIFLHFAEQGAPLSPLPMPLQGETLSFGTSHVNPRIKNSTNGSNDSQI